MQNYFTNAIALLSFLMGVIPTVIVYRNRVIELQNSRRFWRDRAQHLEAQILNGEQRG